MSLRVSVKTEGWLEAVQKAEGSIAANVTRGMGEGTTGLKDDWRGRTLAAKLGQRLANTVRGQVYPKSGTSLDPAGLVWTKAPFIFDSLIREATIVPHGGKKYLAVPTKDTPRKGRSQRMTPLEVLNLFGLKNFILKRSKEGHLLGLVNVIAAKSGKGWRRASAGRLAQARTTKLVIMFVFLTGVLTKKRIDLDALAKVWAAKTAQIIEGEWQE